MKIIKDFHKEDFGEYNLDTPYSKKNIKLMLLDNQMDFSNTDVKNLFRIPNENYPNFEKWYNDKLVKESLITIQNGDNFSYRKHEDEGSLFHYNKNDIFHDVFFNLHHGRLVLVISVEDNLAGISVLKKDIDENKISTFFVEDKYGKMGLATLLLNTSIHLLGNKPIDITVSENNIDKLYPFLKKNGFNSFNTIHDQYHKGKKEFHFKKI